MRTIDYALGAAVIVGAALPLAGGFQRSIGGSARPIGSALEASAATSHSIADAASERQREIDRLAKEVDELRKEAEEAQDDSGFWDSIGSLFGGEVVGTEIGSAVGVSAEPSGAETIDPVRLSSDAAPHWSDDDD